MARTKKRWSYSTGERGRNRVRAFEHASGVLMLEFTDDGRRARLSLGHRDRDKAKQKADEVAAQLAGAVPQQIDKLTLRALFDIYGLEVTPTKSPATQAHDRAAARMFMNYFGAEHPVPDLWLRDFERFIKDRSEGRAGMSGRKVSPRTVEYDLRFLSAVFNWATTAGDGRGGALLGRNPMHGLKMPKEKNPRRVVLTEAEYQAMLAVAREIDPLMRPLLVMANETGHRIGAIRQLRWADIALDEGVIRWRARTDKTGYEHTTPMTQEAAEALREVRALHSGVSDAPVFPAHDVSRCVSREMATTWWNRARARAGLGPKKGRGWHSLRRKFASDLMHKPLKVLSHLGGWKSPQTILMCYQHPDQDQLREALNDRRRSTSTG